MSRRPATTPLLNGQGVKVRFASTSVTDAFGSRRFTSRAQVAPAKPPPITTTRGAAWPKPGRGKRDAAAARPIPFRTLRRFGPKLMPAPQRCAASQAAMAWVSASEKPFAMRSITVAARWPERNSCIACMMSFASRPRIGTTGNPSCAGAWQPEQADAPGGASVCAAAGAASATQKPARIACFAVMEAPRRRARRRWRAAAPEDSHLAEIVVLERQVADALAGRGEDRVEHGGRRHRDRRLADAAPEAARRDHSGLDRGHLVHAHHVVGIEVLLLAAAALDRALAVERRRKAIGEGAFHLPR